MAVGTVLMLVSVAGIGFCLFMLFGEPFAVQTQDTYAPNWEDLGKFSSDSHYKTVFRIRSGLGYRSQPDQCNRIRNQDTDPGGPAKIEKVQKIHVFCAGCSLLRAEGFFL
jgi:hypothetical protein